ncbi:3-coathanger stack domain-containing protein [Aequorivita nionensis]|uniref:3-coathanger stack domain-containing protein n=1 Tax=Aequorivita nionensis TaxID=1287690 RepID=UPI003965B2ED
MRTINYKILLALMAIALQFSPIYSQRENDIWVFGQNKWVFDQNNSFSFSTLNNFISKYSTASISDKSSGQLLFFTNGIKIFDKNGNMMSNGNYLAGIPPGTNTMLDQFYETEGHCGGGTGTNQGTLILPKVGSITNYFVFTNIFTGFKECYAGSNGPFYNFGIQYAEVDMSSTLGNVISKNNTILSNTHGAMTSALGHDESYYWLVTNYQNSFYAYKVDSNGININNPTISSFSDASYENLKISPDGTRILCSDRRGSTQADRMLYEFNNSTGQVTNPLDFTSSNIYYSNYLGSKSSAEFSEDSNIIYFSISDSTIPTGGGQNKGGIAMYNISTQALAGLTFQDEYSFPLIDDHHRINLQRAKNGKIYVIYNDIGTQQYSISIENNYWGVINSPNVWNPSSDPISIINAPSSTNNGYMFPQLIPELSQCVNDLTITENVLNGQNDIQSALNTITATNIVYGGGSATYDAGVTVFLKPGFNAKSGSDFRAFIQGCTVPPIINEDDLTKSNENFDSQKEKVLILHPNPTSGLLNMKSEENMYSWEISNPFGIIQRSGTFKMTDAKNVEIDLSNLITGVYYVKVVFQDGEITTKTLIKE